MLTVDGSNLALFIQKKLDKILRFSNSLNIFVAILFKPFKIGCINQGVDTIFYYHY
jgi:hypothetical protein